MKTLTFKNTTGQGQHINTLKEGFLLEPGQSRSFTEAELTADEIERTKKFFEVTVADAPRPKQQPQEKPAGGKE